MFAIQYLDHDEGSAARWNELSNSRFESRELARKHIAKLRATDDEWTLYSYRVAEIGSDYYYSQPTDCLEY